MIKGVLSTNLQMIIIYFLYQDYGSDDDDRGDGDGGE